jgi:type VI protein secretion system component Hcp
VAVDLFLVLTNGGKNVCVGETLDATYSAKGAVELKSFTLKSNIDLSSDDTSSSAGGEQKKVFTLSIKKVVDNASPDLFRAYCMHATKQEKAFESGTLTVRKSAGQGALEYMTLVLGNVTVQSFKLEASDGDTLPEESIDLAFGTLAVNYYPQKAVGSAGSMITGGWDFGGNISQ